MRLVQSWMILCLTDPLYRMNSFWSSLTSVLPASIIFWSFQRSRSDNLCLNLLYISLGPHCGHPVPHLHRHPLGPGHGEGWAECAGEDRRWPQHLYNWVPLASPHCVSSPHACHLPPGRGVGQEDHLLHLVLRGHSECCQDALGEIKSIPEKNFTQNWQLTLTNLFTYYGKYIPSKKKIFLFGSHI